MAVENIEFEIFPWNENFNTGIELIDTQHRVLVDILNRLAVNLANLSGSEIVNEVFNELAEYTVCHFSAEEKIWDEYFKDDEWNTEHKKTHKNFIEGVLEIKENKGNEPLDDVVYDIVSYLSKWLAYHILATDTRLAIAVREMQSGKDLETAKQIANKEMEGSLKVIIDAVLGMYDSLSGRTLNLMREKALRKRAEEQLKLSEERWKFVLDGGTNSVWDWNIKDNTVKKSDNEESIFEIIKGDGTQGNKTVIHPSDIQEMEQAYKDHIDGKTEFYSNKHRIIKDNGSWVWILSRGKVVERDADGKAMRMVGTHTDITEHEFATLLYENSSNAIIISDANNNMINVNPAFTTINGYTKEEALGRNPGLIASKEDNKEVNITMWKNLLSNGYWSGNLYNKRKNGEVYLSYIEITVITDSKGDIDHYLAISHDISEEDKYKKELAVQESYLLQQSRLAQMGELINMIAHQWRQPLNAISLTVNHLKLKCMLDEIDKELFEDELTLMSDYTQHLSDTIDDFRGFFKKDKIKERTTWIEMLESTLSIIKLSMESKNIEIVSDKVTSGIELETYSNEVKQVILNLLKNAEDALIEKEIENPKITIETVEGEDFITLIIKDNAGGILEENLEKIYDPYFSTKMEKEGTGLGLYISKIIIEEHCEGRLNVFNDEEGAVFEIKLQSKGD